MKVAKKECDKCIESQKKRMAKTNVYSKEHYFIPYCSNCDYLLSIAIKKTNLIDWSTLS